MKNLNHVPAIIEDYTNYLFGILGYSLETVKGYKRDLIEFFSFIKEYHKINTPLNMFNIFILKQIKKQDILAYQVYLNYSKDNSPFTRQRKIFSIKSFFNWLYDNYPGGDGNPAKKIPIIQKVVRLPKYLNIEQSKKIQKIFTIQNSKYPIRNNCIISLFLSTGIRVGELVNIKIKDINLDEKKILIYGKGKKERIVYLNKVCIKQLKEYIEYRKRKENTKELDCNSALFINKNNKRLGVDGIEDICCKAYKLMGLEDKKYTTHTLRHTAASLIYIYVKQDILLLKKFLGHESITSTQIYTHIYNQAVKDAVDKNPLNLEIKKIA